MKANRTFSTVVTHLANCAALLRRVPAVGALLLIAFASPAFAQAPSKPARFTIGVSGGIQQAAEEVSDHFSFPKNVETEEVLLSRARSLHPDKTFPELVVLPPPLSRFRKAG